MKCVNNEEANKNNNSKDQFLSPDKRKERKFFASINEDLNEEAVILKRKHLQKFWEWKILKWRLR